MTGYVVDASVAVKWLVEEVHSDRAATLLDGGPTLVAPPLLFAETANALWVMRRRGDMAAADLADAVETLRGAPVSTPLSMAELMAAATRLAHDLDHPVYDCFYLALALHAQYPVVTADTRFFGKVYGHPYLSDRVVHLADIPAPEM